MDAIEAESNVYHRAAFMLYLLTGLRRSELLTLQWRDVHLEQRTLNLRQTKANRPHRLPLSTPALTILANLPRQHENTHVFPSAGAGHMADLKKPWQRVRERAGLGDVRLHDLRRTVGSMMAQDGVSLQLIGKVLNHTQLSTTEVYARLADDAARDALERHGAKVIDIASRRVRKAG
jgi:integrase